MPATNPELSQDRVADLVTTFDRYGYVMFPQQRAIYYGIAEWVKKRIVVEAGCGNGVGSALLDSVASVFVATDKEERNVKFADCLYPWINFGVWDISRPATWETSAEVVVAVEVIEHVAAVEDAMTNPIEAAVEEVIISTPNGAGKPSPPDNPYHVREYTVEEMTALVMKCTGGRKCRIEVYNWDDLTKPAKPGEYSDPLVYRIFFQ